MSSYPAVHLCYPKFPRIWNWTLQLGWLTNQGRPTLWIFHQFKSRTYFNRSVSPKVQLRDKGHESISSSAIFSKTGFSDISLHLQQTVQVYIWDETDHC